MSHTSSFTTFVVGNSKTLLGKEIRKPENSVIPSSAEIDLNGITTVGNLTEINWTSIFAEITGF